MRIISKERDYYDSVMAHGQDENAVFHRARAEIALPDELKDAVKVGFNYPTQRNRRGEFFIFPFVIAFCGKLYRGIRVDHVARSHDKDDEADNTTTHCFYDLEKYKAFFDQNKLDLADPLYFWHDTDMKKIYGPPPFCKLISYAVGRLA